jgi:hypothetical protein
MHSILLFSVKVNSINREYLIDNWISLSKSDMIDLSLYAVKC